MTLQQFTECLEARVRWFQKYVSDSPATRVHDSVLNCYSLKEIEARLSETQNTLDMLKEVEQ